jgi:hypothetical protein
MCCRACQEASHRSRAPQVWWGAQALQDDDSVLVSFCGCAAKLAWLEATDADWPALQ